MPTLGHDANGTRGQGHEVHRIVATRLQDDGQRYTGGRRAIVEVLLGSTGPLTIPEILAAAADLPQSSAYRNLAVLEKAQVVQRIASTDDWARYELAEDLTEHHHHLICGRCGGVSDFVVPPHVERAVDDVLASAARAVGFTPDHHRLDLVGTCASCA
jgi:Fur family transcriptional regulator, ferric uptake regulator